MNLADFAYSLSCGLTKIKPTIHSRVSRAPSPPKFQRELSRRMRRNIG
jgi:hypothetical protein